MIRACRPYAGRVLPTTTADLLTLLRREPGRPRLTWYAADGDRVELSGAVLDNWVSKTTNLLVEELDVGPGSRVLLDLPTHWRTVVWAMAAWRSGATLVLPDAERTVGADVVVTDRPEEPRDTSAQLVVVSLPALARRYAGALPPGALDAASAVMTYADVIGWVPPTDPASPAVDAAGAQVPHADLFAWAGPQETARALLAAGAGRVDATALAQVLGLLAADGSVVLVDDALAHALGDDPARADRLVSTERVTRRLG